MQLRARHGIADGQQLALAVVGVQAKRRALGHPPAFEDRLARLLEPLAVQLLGARRTARRAVAQVREIGLRELRAREQAHVDRRGTAREDRDLVVGEPAHDFVGLVARHHDERALRVDRHPRRVPEPPDVKHRRDVEEAFLAELARPHRHVLQDRVQQPAMRVVDALRHARRAAREEQQRDVVELRQARAIERERLVEFPRVERRAAGAEREPRRNAELRGDGGGLLLGQLVADDRARGQVAELLLELGQRQERIDGRHLRAGRHDGHQRDVHLDRVRHQQDHALAALGAGRFQAFREAGDGAAEFRVRDALLLEDDGRQIRLRFDGREQHVHEALVLRQREIEGSWSADVRRSSHIKLRCSRWPAR